MSEFNEYRSEFEKKCDHVHHLLKRLEHDPVAAMGDYEGSVFWLCQDALELLTYYCAKYPHHHQEIKSAWRKRFQKAFMTSDFSRRSMEKPLGYSGDFSMIKMIYRNVPRGSCDLGKAIDKWIYALPSPVAVRNRRVIIFKYILELIEQNRNLPVGSQVTSLGAGPAEEVFDLFDRGLTDGRLVFNLIDHDRNALGYLDKKINRNRISQFVHIHDKNIIKLVRRPHDHILQQQDLIYSMGLIDYFKDEFVIKLLDWCYFKLKKGGNCILGNFCTDHRMEHFMNHCLEWHLRLRSRDDLMKLCRASQFASCSMEIDSDSTGIQLFIKATKK